MVPGSDRGLETLLDLNGEVIVLESGLWVKFVIHRIPADERRPHGIAYSLTLHDRTGSRLFGIDNAHPVGPGTGPSRRRSIAGDHLHRGSVVRPYSYVDAGTLLADFWSGVEQIVKSGGVDE